MTFLWDLADRQEPSSAARAKPGTVVWSRRGLLRAALSCSGWLLAIPLLRLTRMPPLLGSYLVLPIWMASFLLATAVSITAILIACLRRSWGVALASVVLAAAGVVTTRLNSQVDVIDYQYREHRAALAELAADYRAGRLPAGDLTLPPDLRSLSPSGYAYVSRTEVFVQMWQNWRHESGTGLAYFAVPPTEQTLVNTAEGDLGNPRREVGGGWWWVA
ncbi:hypothetical protein [Actinoplanes regularis]|uniref:hypothetical protein n=1 Tax=Actinoplanes regularis TaxID=52697 RepID=UPI0025548530|nr:hypothetical protein [Actinoplanes regularis]GLW27764.1 hypothetical protein Areg01_07040 [Actinoplanes regularis]